MTTLFMTGTDTDAGKTLAASGLLYAARQQGLTTLGLKPVASGSEASGDGLRNADALVLQRQSDPAVEYDTVNCFTFAPAIAPHLAAEEAGCDLDAIAIIAALKQTLAKTPRDFCVIEGAGGWRVPLNTRQDFSDLAAGLNVPVILVVGLKLGCLNHARLSAEAIAADGLHLIGWVGSEVASEFAADKTRFSANVAFLSETLLAPCLGVIPHLERPSAEAASEYLSLDRLLLEAPSF
ncbi:dethiobiotin synthase [Halomonas halocynthiae]|uniref:dethiobiotin synthase n=1 Tax=Halomonas halocynthiae TaxID=176290 RepID=UPI00040F3CE2|nr:dethiobiotin synthase [Halomonas halocynthiae]